jgi:hypothetical protein
MTSSLLIVTDRGTFKAYTLEPTPQRGAAPRLREAFDIRDAHGRYEDKVTDQAGAFPAGGTGGQGNSIAEHMSFEMETDARIFRVIAGEITSLLNQHQPRSWSFAAPAEINDAILDRVEPSWRGHLERNVARDLVKIAPSDLLRHFEAAVAA